MGTTWKHWTLPFGRREAHKQRFKSFTATSSSLGCISALFNHSTPVHNDAADGDLSTSVDLRGIEAPRNSLEFDTSTSFLTHYGIDIPFAIQVFPREEEEEKSRRSCSSRTGNVVARLMGLDALPEDNPSTTRRPLQPRDTNSTVDVPRRSRRKAMEAPCAPPLHDNKENLVGHEQGYPKRPELSRSKSKPENPTTREPRKARAISAPLKLHFEVEDMLLYCRKKSGEGGRRQRVRRQGMGVRRWSMVDGVVKEIPEMDRGGGWVAAVVERAVTEALVEELVRTMLLPALR